MDQGKLDLDTPPRRQQVIGGDLTGVAGSQRSGLFNRFADIGLSYWIAGGMVAVILLAFFWPKATDSTREVTQAEAMMRDQLVSSIEPIPGAEATVLPDEPNFTRESDLNRAEEFRRQEEQQRQISALIAKAEEHIANNRLTVPKTSNAVQSYLAALAIDPTNNAAKSGLDDLKDRFLTSGFNALEQDNEAPARQALQQLAAIDKDAEQYADLAQAIEDWRADKKVQTFLSKANAAFKKDNLILPAQANALYFFREALAVDANNKAAQAGIQDIADSFIAKANEAVIEGKYQAAAAHLATVSVIDPTHSSIALIEAMITNAIPLNAASNETTQIAGIPAETANQSTESAQSSNDTDASNPVSNADPVDLDSPFQAPDRPSIERTPALQASEQADFDRQYLKQGLDAYYKGDYETAAALLQPLADKGVARAQFRLAYMHFLGRGFSANRQEADRRIRAALPAIRKFAEEGRAWAQSDLGSLYEDGLVLARDYSEAVRWYRLAAEQGYPGAQTNLGMMYARGRGVTNSRRTAIEWFQRAAKQGDSVAKHNLEALGVN
ncbi:hypothetical protein GCM10008090_09650 [Arenicella chitinivorans]|uniref:Sel1 repeat family protein n=1 Tax=Arenicella chitinivorans TaxID=1329800 RepID=A0A918VK08_9GAMM|nr:hypothetical protein GCM10008090_09650 [Arenicella chitinivorans]